MPLSGQLYSTPKAPAAEPDGTYHTDMIAGQRVTYTGTREQAIQTMLRNETGTAWRDPKTYAALMAEAGTPLTQFQQQDYQSSYNQYQRDTLGAGKFGVRGWMNDHPLGVIAAFVAAAAGGAYAAGGSAAFGGGGAAGGAGAGAEGGLSMGSLESYGAGNAGVLAQSGGISGGAGIGSASGGGAAAGGSMAGFDWGGLIGNLGSAAISNQGSSSKGASETTQSVYGNDYFSRLFGGANAAAGAYDVNGMQQTTAELYGAGSSFLNTLQQQSQGQDASGQYLTGRLNDDSVLNGQIDALGTDLGNFYNQQIMPGINSDAVGAGQLGGGRQGVAQGLGAQAVLQQFASGASNLRAQDQGQRLQAASQLGQQTGAAGQAGIGGLESLYGLAANNYNAAFSPYLTLAQILGDPTVLTHEQSRNGGKSSGFSYDGRS